MRAFAFSLLAFLFIALRLSAGVNEDWNYILTLDAGPKKKPTTREEIALAARNHLHIQHKAIERFLLNHPSDARVFDAKLRLARVVAAEGKLSNDQAKVDEALELLADLEKSAGVPREKLADAGFSRASLLMQSQQGSPRANAGSDRPFRAEFCYQVSGRPPRSTPSCRSGHRVRRGTQSEARAPGGSATAYR